MSEPKNTSVLNGMNPVKFLPPQKIESESILEKEMEYETLCISESETEQYCHTHSDEYCEPRCTHTGNFFDKWSTFVREIFVEAGKANESPR